MATPKELAAFLKDVEKRAFKRALYHVRNDESALDIVQDSMMRLAEHYGERPAAELPLLFQRILSNAMMDWFRAQKLQAERFSPFSAFEADDADEAFDILDVLPIGEGSLAFDGPETQQQRAETLSIIDVEVQKLPARQREAFLLRYWEDLDVAETASTMGCSEGSVKTHCSRAVHSLVKTLSAKGIRL